MQNPIGLWYTITMQPGDLLLVVSKSNVPPNGRYSRGIVLDRNEVYTTVLWADGYHSRELVSNVSRYYTVVPQ